MNIAVDAFAAYGALSAAVTIAILIWCFAGPVREQLGRIPSHIKFLKWRLILRNDLVQAGIDADQETREDW